MPEPRPDPKNLVASLAARGVALELRTLDLCFIAALHIRADRTPEASFSEEQLVDMFEQVCDVIDEGSEPRRRATDSFRRLREQRMLARVDAAGVVRAGEYALTRLATGIVEFFLAQETLNRETLTILTRTLLSSLSEVLATARRAVASDDWQRTVAGPLVVSVTEIVSGIQRRQRGFDLQQEDFQREIGALLQADWFGAIDRCQGLLESTSNTLRELNQVLLRDTHQLQAALHEIQELAAAAHAEPAEEAARRVMEQVDRIAAWGSARQRAWSEYYQYVHRFLRDVVRLDPTRVLTHRLRERLAGQGRTGFALAVAAAPPIRLLRRVDAPPGERPAVRRRAEKEAALVEDPADDPQAKLELDVRAAVAAGAAGLCAITAELSGALQPSERFLAAGRIANAVARVCRADAAAERPWQSVAGDLWIEEWRVAEESRVSEAK